MAAIPLLLFAAFCTGIHIVYSVTDPQDYAALVSLRNQWQNTPPSWKKSDDPCGAPWDGVICNNSRVIKLRLSTMGLIGKLNGTVIKGLTELVTLDLSFNRGLTGSLPSELGDLQKLKFLMLDGCSFSGNIPDELGNLADLTFLSMTSNNLTGGIPPCLGKLTNLTRLDLADNQLNGSLPISTSSTPGLDLLVRTEYLRLKNNQLSGPIPHELFSSEMAFICVSLYGNQFSGTIPSTLGLVQTLRLVRLDGNLLTGKVPSNLNNLTNLLGLDLANNSLTGTLPDLNGMNSLDYVDLSNNSFDQSEAPAWFSTLQSLSTLIIEYGSLQGPVPEILFSFPHLQQVKLRNNAFNSTLNMGNNISQHLLLVDLENNQISSVTMGSGYTKTLMLNGNPVCTSSLNSTDYCKTQQQKTKD